MSRVYFDMLHAHKVVSAKPTWFMPCVKKIYFGAKIIHKKCQFYVKLY
jgi:hypothetical protein